MSKQSQQEKAEVLLSLHRGGELLVLPNVWNPIGPGDEATVRKLRERIESPINILGSPTAAPLSLLLEIGINRVSFGPFLFRSCLRTFVDIIERLRNQGDYACFSDMMSRADVAEYLLSGQE